MESLLCCSLAPYSRNGCRGERGRIGAEHLLRRERPRAIRERIISGRGRVNRSGGWAAGPLEGPRPPRFGAWTGTVVAGALDPPNLGRSASGWAHSGPPQPALPALEQGSTKETSSPGRRGAMGPRRLVLPASTPVLENESDLLRVVRLGLDEH